MKKLLTFIRQGWLVSVLGLAAIGLLIWYAGPFISIADFEPLGEPLYRAIAILLVVAFWGFGRLRAVLKARKNNKQMLDGLVSAAGPEPDPTAVQSEEEISALEERFTEAIAVLKEGQRKRSFDKRYLYQLPWYLFIGPPGAGKTTALVNSGVEFPLAEKFGQDPIRGIAGTRNCDWWFSDEAIFLDTAGRYTTQDSQAEVDQSAWTGFLDLLKRHRRRRPINGVLVAVSVSDVLQLSDNKRKLHARAIRDRIAELHEHLGIRFPVYVIFTKCDLVAGFMEYFSDLGREARSQVWGMTFELPETGSPIKIGEHFDGEFDQLLERLNQRLLTRLQMETDPQRRELTFGFLQQFAALKEPLQEFLTSAFDPSRYTLQPMLRGVYFSSGTQEGNPIDRVMGVLTRRFGLSDRSLPSLVGHGRSYFIGGLLRNLVFPEAGLAGANLRTERYRASLYGGAYALIVGLAALMLFAWFVSYQQNKAFVADVSQQATEWAAQAPKLSVSSTDVVDILPLLNKARALPGADPEGSRGVDLSMRFGLYQGTKLSRQTQNIYKGVLQDGFLPRLMLRLEERIREGFTAPDELYNALRIYLTLTDPSRLEPDEVDEVTEWIVRDWEEDLPREINRVRRTELQTHLKSLLNEPVAPPIPLDHKLVERAQEVLARTPPEERAYARIRASRGAGELEPLRLSEALGQGGLTVLERASGITLSEPLNGLFTYPGYQYVTGPLGWNQLKEAGADTWVLGKDAAVDSSPEAIAKLASKVNKLYYEDYIEHWTQLLGDIRLAQFTSIDDGVRVLRIVSAEDSPLVKLLKMVERQTALDTRDRESASIIAKSRDEFSEWHEKIAAILTGNGGNVSVPSGTQNPVERRFSDLHTLVRSVEEGGPLPVEQPLERLRELYLALNEFANIPAGRRPDRIDTVLGGAVTQLMLESGDHPSPVSDLLGGVSSAVATISGEEAKDQLNRLWGTKVYDFCRKAINGRYPLVASSKREVTLADFGQFFGPGGRMDAFFQENLARHVDTSGRSWRLNRGAPQISSGALRAFQLAHRIKEQFFEGGGSMPVVRFQLRPVSMSADAEQFLLNIDGQSVEYRHDPRAPLPLQWPTSSPTGQVYFRFSPPATYGPSGLTERGPWAWFRILDHAKIKPTNLPERFGLSFKLGNYWAEYELWAASAFNPFDRSELRRFWCPQKL